MNLKLSRSQVELHIRLLRVYGRTIDLSGQRDSARFRSHMRLLKDYKEFWWPKAEKVKKK